MHFAWLLSVGETSLKSSCLSMSLVQWLGWDDILEAPPPAFESEKSLGRQSGVEGGFHKLRTSDEQNPQLAAWNRLGVCGQKPSSCPSEPLTKLDWCVIGGIFGRQLTPALREVRP